MANIINELRVTEADVEQLQHALALADLLSRPNRQDGVIELLLLQLNHTKVRMRPENNHQRPHFHIEYKQLYSASYAVDNFECLAGQMPRKYEDPILKWASERQDALRATWEKLVAGEDVRELIMVKQRPQQDAPADS